jgi:hypothetical protein
MELQVVTVLQDQIPFLLALQQLQAVAVGAAVQILVYLAALAVVAVVQQARAAQALPVAA